MVGVIQENATAGQVYGAIVTVNTATQRCGVLTDGVVIFRQEHTSDVAGTTTTVGRAIKGPPVNATAGDDDGTVAITDGTAADLGRGVILSYVGRYLLVDLSR